jgi:hypothetical protein
MFTPLLPAGDNPIAVNKYIIIPTGTKYRELGDASLYIKGTLAL